MQERAWANTLLYSETFVSSIRNVKSPDNKQSGRSLCTPFLLAVSEKRLSRPDYAGKLDASLPSFTQRLNSCELRPEPL